MVLGDVCVLEGFGAGLAENILLPLPSVNVSTAELPDLSDAMLTPHDLDAQPQPQVEQPID